MKVLCIGGTNDGRVVNVRNGWTIFDLPEDIPSPMPDIGKMGAEICIAEFEKETYFVEELWINNTAFKFARHSSLTAEQCLSKLLNNYKP